MTNRSNKINLTPFSSTRNNRRRNKVLECLKVSQTKKIRAQLLFLPNRVRHQSNKVQPRGLHSQVLSRNQQSRARLRMILKLTLRTHRMVHRSHQSKVHQNLAFQKQVSRNLANLSRANQNQASKSNNLNSQSNQDSKRKTRKHLMKIPPSSTHAFQGGLATICRARQTTCLSESLW
jgi:hypothetical protein